MLLYCVASDRYHKECAETLAVIVVSGGIPSSVTEVKSDCDMQYETVQINSRDLVNLQ